MSTAVTAADAENNRLVVIATTTTNTLFRISSLTSLISLVITFDCDTKRAVQHLSRIRKGINM